METVARRAGLALVLIAVAVLMGCPATALLTAVKEHVQAQGAGPAPQITSFVFTIGFGQYSGVIDQTGGTINVGLPDGTARTALVAIFTTTDTAASVKVNGVQQTSGSTANDFSGPVTYVVTGQNGSTKNYVVTAAIVHGSLIDRTLAGSRQWQCIASSADGKYLAACFGGSAVGDIFTSSDFGATWTDHTAYPGKWTSIASSSTGQYLAACESGGYVWTSGDYGASWSKQTNSGSKFWYSIASSADGTHLAVCDQLGMPSRISTSTDSGVTWTAQTVGSSVYGWRWIASSSDGLRLAACEYSFGANIWTGVYSGGIWTWTNRGTIGNGYWGGIASSSDGMKIAAGLLYNQDIYLITLDAGGGATWTDLSTAGARYWNCVTLSADGSRIAAGSIGDIFTSADGGATWTDRFEAGARNWISIASSSDGLNLAACVFGGDIYSGQ